MTENKSYASFFERLLAKLIDFVVYFMVLYSPLYILSRITVLPDFFNGILNFVTLLLFVALTILPLEIFMISRYGGTVGKLLMGLMIQKDNGKKLRYRESFVRLTLGKAVSGLFFGYGYLWIFKNEKRKAWHDIINHSVVIKKINYGWILGLVIFLVFLLIDLSIVAALILKLLETQTI